MWREDVCSKFWEKYPYGRTVLVTETGYKVLSSSAPKTIKDVEALMSEKGIGNQEIR